MSMTLSLSTNILCTLLLATLAVRTNASLWGWCTHLEFVSVKTMSLSFYWALFIGCSSVLWTCARGALHASFTYLSRALRLSPAYMWPFKDCQHLPYSFWASLSWSLVHFSDIGFILQELFQISYSYQSLNPSLRAIHFSILCPMSLWKAQFFSMSLFDLPLLIISVF